MPLLVEQERQVAQEVNLINVPNQYAYTLGAWGTIHDYGNVTLGSAGILLIKGEIHIDSATGGSGGIRIKVGANYVLTAYSASVTPAVFGTAVYLAAGTYDIKAEAFLNGAGSTTTVYLANFQAGISLFNDQQGASVRTYISGIALTVANRNTPVGALQNATYFVQVYAVTSGASTSLENIGDNLTNGVSIYADGVQVNWSENIQETMQGGASGKMAVSLPVGSSHTITISKRNASTAVIVTAIACPWVLPAVVHIPVNIYFSQGSTLYCTLEPLYANPTKFAGVGAIHGITFGTADDYYSSSSGVDIVNFSFVMDIADILNNNLIAYGLGGCIGIIGVDAR
jgi:hypothetical protein